jgi:hypothetical protein
VVQRVPNLLKTLAFNRHREPRHARKSTLALETRP